jgi:hypothetical protein
MILYFAHNLHLYAVAQVVDALCYKPEGRGFESQWGHWEFFIDLILPAALCLWGLISLVTEINTEISLGCKDGQYLQLLSTKFIILLTKYKYLPIQSLGYIKFHPFFSARFLI